MKRVRRDAPTIQPAVVRLRALPAPDTLDLRLPAGYVCLVADAGAGSASELCRRLDRIGLSPVLLQIPPKPDAGPVAEDAPTVSLRGLDEAAIQAALNTVLDTYGPVGALIYLHPHADGVDGNGKGDGTPFSIEDQALVRAVFLMAKFLQPTLTASAAEAWAGFMTVTGLDGAMGLGDGSELNAGGGLAGLVKTLRLEWPTVACRAVDIAPDLNLDDEVDAIVSELRDPDRSVVEVGRSSAGRVTLEAAWEAKVTGVGEV